MITFLMTNKIIILIGLAITIIFSLLLTKIVNLRNNWLKISLTILTIALFVGIFVYFRYKGYIVF